MSCTKHSPVIGGVPATRMQQLRYIADNYDPKYTTVVTVAELRVFMGLLDGTRTMDSHAVGDAMVQASDLMGEAK